MSNNDKISKEYNENFNNNLVCTKCKKHVADLHLYKEKYVCADCYNKDAIIKISNNVEKRYCPFCRSNELTKIEKFSSETEYEWNVELGKWDKTDERDLDEAQSEANILCQHCDNEFGEDDILIDLNDFDQTWGNLDNDQLVNYNNRGDQN